MSDPRAKAGCSGCGRVVSQRGGRFAKHKGWIFGEWIECPCSGRPRVSGGHRTEPTTEFVNKRGRVERGVLDPQGPWKCRDCSETGKSGFTAHLHNITTDADASYQPNADGRWTYLVRGNVEVSHG